MQFLFTGDILGKFIKLFSSFKVRIIILSAAIAVSLGVVGAVVIVKSNDGNTVATADAAGTYSTVSEQKISAVEVTFNGKSYGFVENNEAAQAAISKLDQEIYGDVTEADFEFAAAVVSADSIMGCDKIVSAVKADSTVMISTLGLFVDDELVAVAETQAEVEKLVEELTDELTSNGAELVGVTNNAQFFNVTATKEFFEQNKVNSDALKEGKYGIEIITKKTVTYESTVSYKTDKKYNSEKSTDYKKVLQEGKNGLKRVTAEVTYTNGEKSSSKVLESTVLQEAVNKIVEYGSKRDYVYHEVPILVSKILDTTDAEMLFPLPVTDRAYITSFWGDGRGHKGIDISSPKGTDVYAALDGTVTYSGWQNGYGYIVIIKHSDTVSTAYAHNSKLIAKVGDKVTQGQVISKVGSTGDSTGNHLHFEVRINGVKVDSAPYVGLK